jgi:hypothetical protein
MGRRTDTDGERNHQRQDSDEKDRHDAKSHQERLASVPRLFDEEVTISSGTISERLIADINADGVWSGYKGINHPSRCPVRNLRVGQSRRRRRQ